MNNNELNNNILENVKSRIAISNLEMEEKQMIIKRKRIISFVAIFMIIFTSGFVTVNAMTNNGLVNAIKSIFNKANITANYGERIHPITGQKIKHSGVDLKGAIGDPVTVVADGEVFEADFDATYGNYIKVKHEIDGEVTYSKYGHLSKIDVKVGDFVNIGDKIGEVGATGMATGPHLHFEMQNANGESIDVNKMFE